MALIVLICCWATYLQTNKQTNQRLYSNIYRHITIDKIVCLLVSIIQKQILGLIYIKCFGMCGILNSSDKKYLQLLYVTIIMWPLKWTMSVVVVNLNHFTFSSVSLFNSLLGPTFIVSFFTFVSLIVKISDGTANSSAAPVVIDAPQVHIPTLIYTSHNYGHQFRYCDARCSCDK